MPTPRRYASHAHRHAAYRKRQEDALKEEQRTRGIPPLPPIPTIPGRRRWNAMTQRILLLLQTIQAEMQDYYDERSDAWQESERAEALNERLQALDEAISAVETINE